ncbi:MAG: chemotaxis protein CheW [Deferrisomatales bacterium]
MSGRPEAGNDRAETRRLLEERARALAAEAPAEDPGATLELASFTVAGERYGVETRYVREVCPLRDLTPWPGAPAFVRGVVNLRGRLVVVVDLRVFFDLPRRGLTDLDRLVVLASEGGEVGLLADAVLGVERVPEARLQPPPAGEPAELAACLVGVTPERLAVLDAGRLLDGRLVVDER